MGIYHSALKLHSPRSFQDAFTMNWGSTEIRYATVKEQVYCHAQIGYKRRHTIIIKATRQAVIYDGQLCLKWRVTRPRRSSRKDTSVFGSGISKMLSSNTIKEGYEELLKRTRKDLGRFTH